MRVDSRDVLDPNARTARTLRGRVVGIFRRTGPNSWDPYELAPADGPELEVMPRIKVQLDDEAPELRLRHEGRVVLLRWLPDQAAQRRIEAGEDARTLLAGLHLRDFHSAPGLGAAAVIANQLSD